MKKSDLRSTPLLECRNGKKLRMLKDCFVSEELEVLDQDAYNEDLTYAYNDREEDIVRIYDDISWENKTVLVWDRDRDETNWKEVPIGTKVLVRDYDYQEWLERYFVKRDGDLFYALAKNATTSGSFRQCKLAEEPVTAKEIYNIKPCRMNDDKCIDVSLNCSKCTADAILKNYNLTRK